MSIFVPHDSPHAAMRGDGEFPERVAVKVHSCICLLDVGEGARRNGAGEMNRRRPGDAMGGEGISRCSISAGGYCLGLL